MTIADFSARYLTRTILAGALLLSMAGGAWAIHRMTAQSGVPTSCGCDYWRVDNQGKEWPISIQYTTKPANGTVRTVTKTAQRTLRNGKPVNVHVTEMIYTSKKGYVGEDSFSYRRITGDPTDANNGKEYTIAVTVR